MRKPTTTQKLNNTIKNNLLILERAEIHYKTSSKAETIDAVKFKEYFTKLCESEIFADAVGWHYEREYKTGQYIAECSRMNGDSDIIIIAYLRVNEGVSADEVEKELLFQEE